MDKPPEKDSDAPDRDAEKRLMEKDRDFKRVCQRYARMRARSGR
jgi:hypothetical protein